MNRTLAPKNLEGLLGETFTIYKNNFLRLIAIAAIVLVPIFILYGIYIVAMLSGLDNSDFPSYLFLFYILLIPIGLLMFAASIWMVGAIIHAVAEHYFHQPISIGRAYSFAWRRLAAMFGAAFIVYLAIMGIYLAAISIGIVSAIAMGESSLGSILAIMVMMAVLICGALSATAYLGINWNFQSQAVLLEKCSPTTALSRSWALVKGSWWRILGILLLLGCIMQAIIMIIMMIFYIPAITAMIGGTASMVFTPSSPTDLPHFPLGMIIGYIIAMIGGIIGNIISYPIYVIGHTLLYFDMRVRKEGYSLDIMANELGLVGTSTEIGP